MALYSDGFPRDIKPMDCSRPKLPGALYSTGQTGKTQARNITAVARVWTETWNNFDPFSQAGAKLLQVTEYLWNSGDYFGITPACFIGRPRLGVATGTGAVNGGSQTGASLITDGWTGSALIARQGEMVVLSDSRCVRELRADASHSSGAATLLLWPPLLQAPADNTTLTVGFDLTWHAILAAPPEVITVGLTGHGLGLRCSFREYFTA